MVNAFVAVIAFIRAEPQKDRKTPNYFRSTRNQLGVFLWFIVISLCFV